jgi:hypothetical protein
MYVRSYKEHVTVKRGNERRRDERREINYLIVFNLLMKINIERKIQR